MSQISLPTGPSPLVQIESILGKLEVKGWDRSEILLKASSGEDPVLEQREDSYQIRCTGDCFVRVPKDAILRAGQINGNASFKMLEDGLQIELVAGSLVLRDIDNARVTRVHGELLARQVEGDLFVEEVFGSVTARDVQGACVFQRVGGNLVLRDTEGNVDATALGNAHIQLSMLQGEQYSVSASGNLECRITEDASAQVELASGARNIRVRTHDSSKTYTESSTHLSLGEGATQVKLSAGGSLSFVCEESAWTDMGDLQGEFDDAFSVFSEEFTEQFSENIQAQIESQMNLLDEQMSHIADVASKAGLSDSEAARIQERARAVSERANAQAQERLRRAQEKVERKMAAAQRKAELRAQAAQRRANDQRRRTWNVEWTSSPPAPPRPPAPPADEERLMILRMLQQKKITLDEAEKLLAALENNPT